jgi:adenosine kinase
VRTGEDPQNVDERRMLFQVSHVQQPENWKILEKAKVIYSAGFFITASPESILLVAKHAAQSGQIYCMNLSAPFISEVRPYTATP